jgi:sialidase-1
MKTLDAIFACLLASVVSPLSTQEIDAADLSASVTQRVHPVLVRNEHNALFRITISAESPFVELRALTVSLRGTDDHHDIDALELFFAGEDGNLSTAMRFGDALQPGGQTVVMRGHARLHQGENHFWLSCRLAATASLDHKVDATCVDIDTTAGHIKPVDRTGDLRKRIGIALRKHYDDGVHTYRIPALATTPQNTLLCVYDMRRRTSRDLQEDIDIGLLRSVDGGQTWEPQRIIMDQGTYGGNPQELNGVSDPGIIVDPATGEIFCFAVWMVGKEGKHQWIDDGSEPGFEIGKSAQLLMVRSRDDGQTWSKPQNMTRAWKKKEWVLYAPSPQQGIALADGTLVMPTQGRNPQGREFSNLLTSDDHGAHWTVSQPASVGNSECQAVQLGDGSIMLNMRTEHTAKLRTVATTRDLGQTWVPHVTNRKTLIEPGCNGSLCRFDFRQGGHDRYVLLFANPHSQTGRDHHSIRVSFDDGVTWPEENRILLDEFGGAGYPSLSRVDDTHVGIVYEGSQAHLVFERLSLDELLQPGD